MNLFCSLLPGKRFSFIINEVRGNKNMFTSRKLVFNVLCPSSFVSFVLILVY